MRHTLTDPKVGEVPAPLQARGSSGPGKFFAYYGLFGRFSLRKHDLSVCFSVHIIKVKPAENDGFYGMDAYGCKETWATVDTLL